MAMASQHRITIEEFLAHPDRTRNRELVRGRIVTMDPPKPRHGRICARLATILTNFSDEHQLGEVLSNDTGVIVDRDPDTLRGADVSFYRRENLPGGVLPDDTYPEYPPDFVVEVRSEGDRWADVIDKVGDYLRVGVRAVLVVDPFAELAHIYRGDAPVVVLGPDDEITLPDILGELRIPVRRCLG